MSDVKIEELPFYWRLSPRSHKVPNIVDDCFPFTFGFDAESSLVTQQRNENVLTALECIYKQEYNIGYLQDGNEIAKPYGKDFITYLQSALKKNPNIKKILEIGCGGCVVLDILKRSGYEVCGIDSSPFAATEGAKKGIDVITDFFPSNRRSERFDMIFHVDVLEHINDYIDFLRHQYKQLNDEGIMIVNVPDATDSIKVGDISMAMHQHLNYFTETSLSAALRNAGFEVISMSKAGYGGSLYAIGRKKRNVARDVKVSNNSRDYENFSNQAEQMITSFCECSERVLSDSQRTLGFYVPLRTLPYIARQGIYGGFRFFDDTVHWHMNVFDGIDVPVENFDDLKKNPVTDLIIMSLTFGDVIRNKVLKEFGECINVVTLSNLTDGDEWR
jgi:2-polyprenyl-3-methyl-5-hydroxy-6-metoxy-1,4-benzoquinol methylase